MEDILSNRFFGFLDKTVCLNVIESLATAPSETSIRVNLNKSTRSAVIYRLDELLQNQVPYVLQHRLFYCSMLYENTMSLLTLLLWKVG